MSGKLLRYIVLLCAASTEVLASPYTLGINSNKKTDSIAYDMNTAGQVAATLNDEKGIPHGVFFEKGQQIRLDLPGGTESDARRINEQGVLIGSSNKKDGRWMAFLYSRASGMQELGTLGGPSSHGLALNNAGDAVGFADTANREWHAFLTRRGQPMKDLGTFGGKISYASAINNAGQVVGTATTPNGERHAFLYDDERGMIDLGTLGGRFSYASAINDQGIVVGTSEMQDRSWHAFIYDGKSMTDLGARIGIGDSFAAGINNAGHVVGTYKVAGERYGDRRNSFVWRDNQVILHNSGKGLYLTNAINNQGQIIGATYDRGMDAAAMHSNAVPFVDLGGSRIIGFNLLMIVLAAILVIFRKRWKGLFFGNKQYSAN